MKYLTQILGLSLLFALIYIFMNRSETNTTNNGSAAAKPASVIVINPIEIPKGREAEALKIWDTYAEYFRMQPGYLGTALHEAVDPKAKFFYINVAEWASPEDFMNALSSEEIKSLGEGFPADMPHYPSLYRIVRN